MVPDGGMRGAFTAARSDGPRVVALRQSAHGDYDGVTGKRPQLPPPERAIVADLWADLDNGYDPALSSS
jgi:hypothetical protein